MHPEIKKFWNKIGEEYPIHLGKKYDNSYWLKKDHAVRCIYLENDGKKLYWYYPTWAGNIGKWYSEKEMLKIIGLKAFA